jgi:hypothetical protein
MRWLEHRDKGYFPQFINKLEDEDIEVIIERLFGFTKVIEALEKTKKPIVGHNMLMDLILLVKQFYVDLPPAYDDFKALTHQLFPIIYDSKHVSAALRLELGRLKQKVKLPTGDMEFLYDTSLFGLYQNTSKVKDIFTPYCSPINGALLYKNELFLGFEQNLETVKEAHCHQAALDACITGK